MQASNDACGLQHATGRHASPCVRALHIVAVVVGSSDATFQACLIRHQIVSSALSSREIQGGFKVGPASVRLLVTRG